LTVLRITQMAVYVKHRAAVLRVTQSGSFAYNTGWQFYVSQRVAFLRITEDGMFTCSIRWEFYV